MEKQATPLIDKLYREMYDFQGEHGIETICALVADRTWMKLLQEARERLPMYNSGPQDSVFRIGGMKAVHFPLMMEGWLIGPEKEIESLRKLAIAAKDKDIRHFIENFEP